MRHERTQAERAELEKTAKTMTKVWKWTCYAIAAMAVVCTFFNPAHIWTALLAYGMGKLMTFEVDNGKF